MTLRIGDCRPAEDCWRMNDHTHAMWNQWFSSWIARMLIASSRSTCSNRITHAMTEMNTSTSETDTSVATGQDHCSACLIVAGIEVGTLQKVASQTQRLKAPEVGERRAALVGGTLCRRGGTSTTMERQSGVALQGVREHVEAGGGGHFGGHAGRVERIDQRQRGTKRAVCDAGLGIQRLEVEDADAGHLATGAGGGGDADHGRKRARWCETAAHRRVHVVQKVVGRIGGQKHGRFAGVQHATAAHRHEQVKVSAVRAAGGTFTYLVCRSLERAVGRLDADQIRRAEDLCTNAVRTETLQHRVHWGQIHETFVGEHRHMLGAHVGGVCTHLGSDPATEPHRTGSHLEGVLAVRLASTLAFGRTLRIQSACGGLRMRRLGARLMRTVEATDEKEARRRGSGGVGPACCDTTARQCLLGEQRAGAAHLGTENRIQCAQLGRAAGHVGGHTRNEHRAAVLRRRRQRVRRETLVVMVLVVVLVVVLVFSGMGLGRVMRST
mmetsp:Transcript_35334/g.88814  ORF Transcript_35334/g.88814 Transcript_35334/m.88814 type:complete len:496 (-) Transcript_35334:203-1690(-)